MSEWRPIETAPTREARNTAVLVYVPTVEDADERVTVARFWGAWLTVEGGRDIEPTHWMPFPEPPESTKP